MQGVNLPEEMKKSGLIYERDPHTKRLKIVQDLDLGMSAQDLMDQILNAHLSNINDIAFEDIPDRDKAAGRMVNLMASKIVFRSKVPEAGKEPAPPPTSQIVVIQNISQLGLQVTTITKENIKQLKESEQEASDAEAL